MSNFCYSCASNQVWSKEQLSLMHLFPWKISIAGLAFNSFFCWAPLRTFRRHMHKFSIRKHALKKGEKCLVGNSFFLRCSKSWEEILIRAAERFWCLTPLQSMMNAKLSLHGFWYCHETGSSRWFKRYPHNLYVSFKSPSLYCELGYTRILNPQ